MRIAATDTTSKPNYQLLCVSFDQEDHYSLPKRTSDRIHKLRTEKDNYFRRRRTQISNKQKRRTQGISDWVNIICNIHTYVYFLASNSNKNLKRPQINNNSHRLNIVYSLSEFETELREQMPQQNEQFLKDTSPLPKHCETIDKFSNSVYLWSPND